LVGSGVALFALLEMDRLAGTRAQGQSPANGRVPTIDQYQPESTLVTPEHHVERAKYPFVDIHSHHWNPTSEHVDQVVKEMNTINASDGESERGNGRRGMRAAQMLMPRKKEESTVLVFRPLDRAFFLG
jgi:hypothetical protein